jgi:glutamine synthetase
VESSSTSVPSLGEIGVGKVGFIDAHKLWTEEQSEAAERLAREIDDLNLRQVRISWGDQHGILRSKTVSVQDFSSALRNGHDFQSATLVMDTTNNIFVPLFVEGGGFGIPEMSGYPDVILVPDPTTFRTLPWVGGTGWILCDMYFSSGKPVPFSTRQILRTQLERLREAGYEYVAGLEVEFYITRMEDPMLAPEQSGYPPDAPKVSAVAHGFQYLTENRNDEIDDILQDLARNLTAVGVPLRSMEDEWGPGQVEFTLDPQVGLASADTMLLFRSAIKQVCRRHGLHASFMCRPALANFFSNGWHLHQSLRDVSSGRNAFTPGDDANGPISDVARFFAGGILEHAAAASVFTTPTINGYKRFQPNSFAPSKVTWAYENRGAMIRVIGGPGDEGTHLENRIGEPCANPYLYMASQIAAGLDGLEKRTDPGAFHEEPYQADRPEVPASLIDSINALREDTLYRERFGTEFIEYILMMKTSEWRRFLSHVTDWEQREYFEVF